MSDEDKARERALMAEDYVRRVRAARPDADSGTLGLLVEGFLAGHDAGANPRVTATPEEALVLRGSMLAYRRHFLSGARCCWMPVAPRLRLERFDPHPEISVPSLVNSGGYAVAKAACARVAARTGLRLVEISDVLGPRFVAAFSPGAPLPVARQAFADLVRVDGRVFSRAGSPEDDAELSADQYAASSV